MPSSRSTRSTPRRLRASASASAERLAWLEADPEPIAEQYRSGELDVMDLVRRYGVVLDWDG